MSEGNKSDDKSSNNGESSRVGGLGSAFLKVVGVATAVVAVPLGICVIWSKYKQQPPLEVSARPVIKISDDEDRARLLHHRDTPLSLRITKPDQLGWVKLNVSTSHDHKPPPSAGCGGVLRDPSGTWLIGFANKMDPSYEDHVTAIEAILKGMELALEMNVKELVVESDNKSAVFLVESGVGTKYNLPPYNSISRIRQLLLDPKWKVKVIHISREVNRVANRLARDACNLPFEYLRKYPYPPANCTTLLQEDAKACLSP